MEVKSCPLPGKDGCLVIQLSGKYTAFSWFCLEEYGSWEPLRSTRSATAGLSAPFIQSKSDLQAPSAFVQDEVIKSPKKG